LKNKVHSPAPIIFTTHAGIQPKKKKKREREGKERKEIGANVVDPVSLSQKIIHVCSQGGR